MIQHLRDVVDPRRALHQPQQQVVVLRALVAGPEPADLVQQRAPHHHQVARVHAGQEVLGRPVGLEVRLAARARQVQLVFVRVDDVGVGMCVEVPDDLEQRVRRQLVVVIEQRDELAVRQLQRGVRGGRDAAVRRGVANADPRIGLRTRAASAMVAGVVEASSHRHSSQCG